VGKEKGFLNLGGDRRLARGEAQVYRNGGVNGGGVVWAEGSAGFIGVASSNVRVT